ncbi:hypothetical protein [Pseudomonas nicosulfuronedens]
MEAFLAAGGEVEQVKGFEPKARPARAEPEVPAPIKQRRADEPVLISCRGTVVRKNYKQAAKAYERRKELAECVRLSRLHRLRRYDRRQPSSRSQRGQAVRHNDWEAGLMAKSQKERSKATAKKRQRLDET